MSAYRPRRVPAERRRFIGRRCLDCNRITYTGSRCPFHAAIYERERVHRQRYRLAYQTVEYRRARAARIRGAGERCEALVGRHLDRCSGYAQEAHHLVPLASARSLEEAVALCRFELLRAVCWRHNPRGGTVGPQFGDFAQARPSGRR